jgi:glutathione S-transferase
MPTDAKAIATVRMVQQVTLNELWSPMIRLSSEAMGFVKNDPQKLEKAHQQVLTVLNFFENLLSNSPYFANNRLTLADITAGTMVPQLPSIGVPLDNYPKLRAWIERLMARPSWQKSQPSPEEIEALMPQAKALMTAHLT